MPTPLLQLCSAAKDDFGRRTIVADHTIAQSGLFTDAALIDLLDRFPRQDLHALTMGNDPARRDQNRLVSHDGVSGEALLRAVRQGCLWLNLTRVDRADARYRALIDRLYAELAGQLSGFEPDSSHGNLLISSPHASVYFHVDGPASVLWHLRGRKRVWVYPALDTRFVEREALEDILAGARHEYLPYDPAFESAALVRDLEPGQWIAWAQNAPHRVSNLEGLNVSLTTEHFTPQGRRRARLYAANRFLRMQLGLADLSTRETGAAAMLKMAAHLITRKSGLDRTRTKRHDAASLRIDAESPGGFAALAPGDGSAVALS